MSATDARFLLASLIDTIAVASNHGTPVSADVIIGRLELIQCVLDTSEASVSDEINDFSVR